VQPGLFNLPEEHEKTSPLKKKSKNFRIGDVGKKINKLTGNQGDDRKTLCQEDHE
jgi:hypothetical protein